MKVIGLIKLLEEKMNEHGDIPINYFDVGWCGFSDVEGVAFAEYEECLVLELEE